MEIVKRDSDEQAADGVDNHCDACGDGAAGAASSQHDAHRRHGVVRRGIFAEPATGVRAAAGGDAVERYRCGPDVVRQSHAGVTTHRLCMLAGHRGNGTAHQEPQIGSERWSGDAGKLIDVFGVTNLAVWAAGSLYPRTLAGLIMCYSAAIPFFRNSLIGDVAYAATLFGGFASLENVVISLREKQHAVTE